MADQEVPLDATDAGLEILEEQALVERLGRIVRAGAITATPTPTTTTPTPRWIAQIRNTATDWTGTTDTTEWITHLAG